MQEQCEQAGRRHRLGGVVARADQLHEEAGDVGVREVLPVELLVEEHGGQVGPGFVGPPVGDEAHGVRSHLEERRLIACPLHIGILAGQHALGHEVHGGPVLLGETHEPPHDTGRQGASDVMDEVEVGSGFTRFTHDPPADCADLVLQTSYDFGLEAGRERLAVRHMARRIHDHQHVAAHLQGLRCGVLEGDAALARREQGRMTRNVHHVGVREHGEEAALPLHLLPDHGLGPSQLSQQVMWRPVREKVRIRESLGSPPPLPVVLLSRARVDDQVPRLAEATVPRRVQIGLGRAGPWFGLMTGHNVWRG